MSSAEILLARLVRFWPAPMRKLPFREATLRGNHHVPFAVHPSALWDYFVFCGGATETPDLFGRRYRAAGKDEL